MPFWFVDADDVAEYDERVPLLLLSIIVGHHVIEQTCGASGTRRRNLNLAGSLKRVAINQSSYRYLQNANI
jgi:hypothetical protein